MGEDGRSKEEEEVKKRVKEREKDKRIKRQKGGGRIQLVDLT